MDQINPLLRATIALIDRDTPMREAAPGLSSDIIPENESLSLAQRIVELHMFAVAPRSAHISVSPCYGTERTNS